MFGVTPNLRAVNQTMDKLSERIRHLDDGIYGQKVDGPVYSTYGSSPLVLYDRSDFHPQTKVSHQTSQVIQVPVIREISDPFYERSTRVYTTPYTQPIDSSVRFVNSQYYPNPSSTPKKSSKRRRTRTGTTPVYHSIQPHAQISSSTVYSAPPINQINKILFPPTQIRSSFSQPVSTITTATVQSGPKQSLLKNLNGSDLFLPEDVRMLYTSASEVKSDFRAKIDVDCDYVKSSEADR